MLLTKAGRAVLLCVLAMFCAAAANAEYEIIWQEEFDGSSLSQERWSRVVQPGVVTRAWDAACYTDQARNASIKDGVLLIKAGPTKKSDVCGFTSARLSTYDLFAFTYGRIEARMKVPASSAMRPRLWLMPVDLHYGGWPACGEVDVAQFTSKNELFAEVMFGGPRDHRRETHSVGADKHLDASGDFHVYTLEWQPYEMRWYVDGDLYAVQRTWSCSNAAFPAPFDRAFYLMLGMGVDKAKASEAGSRPHTLMVDWIRVYQATGNKPPKLKLISPPNGAKLPAGPIRIEAEASDPDGNLAKVEFYNGDTLIGTDDEAPFRFMWDTPDGCYHIVARAVDADGFACSDAADVESGNGCPPKPYLGRMQAIPGRIEAENYDSSIKGEGYFDHDPTNNGGAYRPDEGVDIQPCSEGGFNTCWMMDGEWMQYTVNVAESGEYDVKFRVGSPFDTARVRIEMDGEDVTGVQAVPQTGDWQRYSDLTVNSVRLEAGKHVMRFVVVVNGLNLNYVEFAKVE